jgi:hypothetical protein
MADEHKLPAQIESESACTGRTVRQFGGTRARRDMDALELRVATS